MKCNTQNEEVEMKTTSQPILDAAATQDEWVILKQVVVAQRYPRDNIVELWRLIGQFHSEEFPNMIKLGHLALTSPVHTAGCERGFSAQNLILTALRNRLTAENQDMLMRVKLHGRSIDLERALAAWCQAKPRKL